MKIFDAHIRSDSKGNDDLQNLLYFETRHVLTTSHAPRKFDTASDLLGYFEFLLTTETSRIKQIGLHPHVALGVLPGAMPRRAHYEVWDELPRLLRNTDVVAVGEIGVWQDTPKQWELFERQVMIALDAGCLPLVITPPHEYRVTLTYKMMRCLERLGFPCDRVVINYLDERLIENVIQSGFVAGLVVGAASMSPRQAALLLTDLYGRHGALHRVVLSSGLRSGGGDVLGIPKTIVALQASGMDIRQIERLAYENAMTLFMDG